MKKSIIIAVVLSAVSIGAQAKGFGLQFYGTSAIGVSTALKANAANPYWTAKVKAARINMPICSGPVVSQKTLLKRATATLHSWAKRAPHDQAIEPLFAAAQTFGPVDTNCLRTYVTRF